MSTLLAAALSLHVIAGIVGVMASYAVTLHLLKKDLSLNFLKISSLLAFLSYLASWFSGGYYYVIYYGGVVKPIIKEGAYPWAHLVMMETKEHAFLMLPFATLVLAAIFFIAGEQLRTDTAFKRAVLLFAGTVTILATIITIMGMLVSGAAR